MTSTAQLCAHARERCQQMGVTTKRVKRIVRDPHVDYVSHHDSSRRVCFRTDDDITVVYEPGDQPRVVTVLWRSQETYERIGRTG